MLNHENWAKKQWPAHVFFDARHQQRVLKIALAMLKQPSASIPGRFDVQKEVKGCYRLLDNKMVNHTLLQKEHYKNVLEEAASSSCRVAFFQDGSELLYNNLNWTDLGPTSDSNGNGIMFHSCLAVKLDSLYPQVIGLAGQKAWIRNRIHDKKHSKAEEERESRVWQELTDRIGPVPKGCKWIVVGDRGSDIFSYLGSLPEGLDCILRSKHDRKILVNNQQRKLKEYMRQLPSMGTTVLALRARKDPSREVTINFSWAKVDVLPPEADKEKDPIKGGCYLRSWCEEDPDLEWILFTRSSIISLEEALEIINIYKHRWLIEEYHKCLKTGCQIEKAQLKTAGRLLTLFGMVGVVATQLLQLKSVARINPDEPAEKYVDKISVIILQTIYELKTPLTVKEYWRHVAMLVGFMGRKSDGDPGWQKIWKGWIKLRDMCRGVELGRTLGAELF